MKIMLLILALLVYCSLSFKDGLDVSGKHDSETVHCYYLSNMNMIIVKAYTEYGLMDPHVVDTLKKVAKTGMRADISFSFCRGKDPTDQMTQALLSIPSDLYSYLWINLQKNVSPGCGWDTYTPLENCLYISKLTDAAHGKSSFGMYSTYSDWMHIFKSAQYCDRFSWYSIWYGINDNEKDIQTNFTKFGGWTTANMKRFAYATPLCGKQVNLDNRII